MTLIFLATPLQVARTMGEGIGLRSAAIVESSAILSSSASVTLESSRQQSFYTICNAQVARTMGEGTEGTFELTYLSTPLQVARTMGEGTGLRSSIAAYLLLAYHVLLQAYPPIHFLSFLYHVPTK